MQHNLVEIRVLVRGKPVVEYSHRGQTFIEGRSGSAYEIEIRNNNAFRVEAVVSVDGLSVIDGKEAGIASSGYALAPRETVRIPGWKLDEARAASFEFGAKSESYATSSTGSARNNGVIGVIVFRERFAQPVLAHNNGNNGWMMNPPVCPITTAQQLYNYGDHTFNLCNSSGTLSPLGGASLQYPIQSCYTMNAATATASDGASFRSAGAVNNIASSGKTKTSGDILRSVEQSTLGTGFGAAQEFVTSVVEFARGDMLAMMVLYYDEAKGLRQRGIQVGRRAEKFAQQPQAFPGMVAGCEPPPGWRG